MSDPVDRGDTAAVRSAAAVLLAAGASERMSTPKALLPWPDHGTLLAHNLAELTTTCSGVVVVLGAYFGRMRQAVLQTHRQRREAARTAPLVWVENRAHRQGKAGSVRCGVRAVPGRAQPLVVATVDQPLAPGLLTELIAAWWERQPPVLVPRFDGRRGHPPLFAPELIDEIRRVREDGQGLRAVVRRHQDRLEEVPVDTPTIHWNLNDRPAYLRARRRWARRWGHREGAQQ